MFCSVCGRKLSDDARFCDSCGAVMNAAYQAQPQQVAYQAQPQQVAYQAQPQQVAYQPQPQQVAYQPQPQQVAYQAQPQQVAYQPQSQQVAYQAQPQQVTYQPQPQQVAYQPQPQQVVYQPVEDDKYQDQDKSYDNIVRLLPRERGFMIASCVIHLVMCAISGIMSIILGEVFIMLFASFMAPSDAELIVVPFLVVSLILVAAHIVFAIMGILKKRWALQVIRVFMTIGVFAFAALFLIRLIALDWVSLIVYAVVIAYCIMMINFLNIAISPLSRSVQVSRRNVDMAEDRSRRRTALGYRFDGRAGVNSGDTWTCKKCGTKNPRIDSFCRDCGEYK